MKGMVRIIAAALFAVCVTAALAGCSFRADETGTSDSGSEQRSDVSSERSVPEQSAPEDSSSRTEDSDGASTSAPEQPKPPKDTSEPVGSVPEQSDPPEESAPESNPESEPEPSDEPEPADLPDCAQLYAAAVAGTEMPPYFVLADIPDTAETDENTAPLSIAYPNLDTAQLEDFYATMPKTIVNAAEAAVFLPGRPGRKKRGVGGD